MARARLDHGHGTRIADFWLTAVGEVPLTTLEQLAQGRVRAAAPATGK